MADAYVMIGIDPGPYLTTRVVTHVTKYNEDTGAPYKKEVVEEMLRIGTWKASAEHLATIQEDGLSCFLCEELEEVIGLEAFWVDYKTNGEYSYDEEVPSLIGLTLSKAVYNLEQITAVYDKVKTILMGLGIEEDPKLYHWVTY